TGLDDYAYDADGNLSKDLNKKVSSITYNELDQPTLVQFTDGVSQIANTYTAGGALVKRVVTDSTSTSHTYRYWGPFVYKDDVLQYILHQEGRTRWLADSSVYKYDYFVKDHLGNVRTVLTSDVGNMTDYTATHEVVAGTMENSIFTNIDYVRDF